MEPNSAINLRLGKMYVPTGPANSQSNAGMTSEQECESPGVAQPKVQTIFGKTKIGDRK